MLLLPLKGLGLRVMLENLVYTHEALSLLLFQIMLHYNVPDYRNSLEFLTLLAQKRGMLKKGGLADTESAAKLFLYDWTG